MPESKPKAGGIGTSPHSWPSSAAQCGPSARSWPTGLERPCPAQLSGVYSHRPGFSAQNGHGSLTTSHPSGPESQPPSPGACPGRLRGPSALEPAACQAALHLALNSTSLQPRPPARHPESNVAWPLGHVRECQGDQISQHGLRTLAGYQSSQAAFPTSRIQPEPSPPLL